MAAQAINLQRARTRLSARPSLSPIRGIRSAAQVELPGRPRARRSGTLNQTTVTANNVCHRLGMGHKNQINDGHYSGDCDYDNENNKGDHHYDHDDNDNTVMMNYNE